MVFASRVSKIYPYLHILLLGGCLLWYRFGNIAPDSKAYILCSLLGYGLIVLSFGWMTRKNIFKFDNLLFVHGIFDAIIIGVIVSFTGGYYSEFYLAFFPAVALAAVVASGWRCYTGAVWFGLCYWLSVYPSGLDSIIGINVYFRIILIWSVGALAYSVSYSMRSYETKLLKTLDILNERTWELENSQSQITDIYETTRALSGILDLDHLLAEILNVANKIFQFARCHVFLSNVAEDCLYLYASLEDGNRRIFERPSLYVRDNNLNSGFTDKTGNTISDDFGAIGGNIDTSLISRGRVIGILRIATAKGIVLKERERNLLTIFANSAAVAIDNSLLHKKTEELTITDALTELFNYRYFRNKLSDEVRRADRYRQRFTILMLDLDHFKLINDKYGHQTGNIVLKEIAGIVKQCLRDVDVVARYGGEEFVAILPQTGDNDALMIAERIRDSVEQAYFSNSHGQRDIHMTISIGVASYPGDAHTAEQLLDKVDKALYEAKADGRNKVRMFDPELQQTIKTTI